MQNIQKYFLEISYLGTNYFGWQFQKNAITVQQKITEALEIYLKHPVKVLASGRTDTGVHAKQQFVQFCTSNPITEKIIIALNALLPYDISVKNIYKVPENASARFDALKRKYVYSITRFKNPFYNHLAYFFPFELNLDIMNQACEIILQTNDFECFCKLGSNYKHHHCTVYECFWEHSDELILFHITANRFLRGMVRAIVGTLMDVGQNKISLEKFRDIIQSKKRSNAGRNVPPQGLTLLNVWYPEGYLKKI